MKDILKPLLATQVNPDKDYEFPYYLSPKKDGVRCLTHPDGDPQSRSGEYLQNPAVLAFTHAVRHYLTDHVGMPERYYIDGELLKVDYDLEGNFSDCPPNDTTGLVNSYTTLGDMCLYIFDCVESPSDPSKYFPTPYHQRIELLQGFINPTTLTIAYQFSESGLMHIGYWPSGSTDNNGYSLTVNPGHIPQKYRHHCTNSFTGTYQLLNQSVVHNWEQVDTLTKLWLSNGDEGSMLRSINAGYKFGRCAKGQDYLVKIKPFEDDEALIIGLEPAYTTSESGKSKGKLGQSKTDSKKANKTPTDRLGKFIVEHPHYGRFAIGTGFDHTLAKLVWANPNDYIGKLLTFRYQKVGTLDKPRIPSFIKFRDPVDL